MTADYDARVKAVQDATALMCAMSETRLPPGITVQVGASARPVTKPLDRFEVVELARFLLGLDDEPLPEATP